MIDQDSQHPPVASAHTHAPPPHTCALLHTPHTLVEALSALLQIVYHALADSSGAAVPNIALLSSPLSFLASGCILSLS